MKYLILLLAITTQAETLRFKVACAENTANKEKCTTLAKEVMAQIVGNVPLKIKLLAVQTTKDSCRKPNPSQIKEVENTLDCLLRFRNRYARDRLVPVLLIRKPITDAVARIAGAANGLGLGRWDPATAISEYRPETFAQSIQVAEHETYHMLGAPHIVEPKLNAMYPASPALCEDKLTSCNIPVLPETAKVVLNWRRLAQRNINQLYKDCMETGFDKPFCVTFSKYFQSWQL